MTRNESSRLGELQSEGNLGNERNRNMPDGTSGRSRKSERVRNRSSEDSMSDRGRSSEERSSGEEWDSGDADSSASRSDRSSS
jgi:hypothetical protein